MSEHYRETRYGFEWGAAKVSRCASHKGHVVLTVVTPKERLDIRVTPSGLIKLDKGIEKLGKDGLPATSI